MTDDKDDRPPMSAERFAALSSAYGADLRRWPEDDRAAGAMFAASEAGQNLLTSAGILDARLDTYHVAAPDKAMHDSILRAASAHITQRRRRRFWWLGLGLAGIGLAGAVAGLALATIVLPETGSDQYLLDGNVTAFGDAVPEADNDEESL